MAMDDRQKQIRERAGLEESRLNQEFIDLIGKAGFPILLVAALAIAGYAGWQRWTKYQDSKLDTAFQELEAVSQQFDRTTQQPIPANPASLTDVASRYAGRGSVTNLARMRAADTYLQMVRQMVKLGTKIEANGSIKDPKEALDGDSRRDYLAQAKDLYGKVLLDTERDPAKVQIAVGAAFGLAAVAESEPNFDDAKKAYERIIALTTDTTFNSQAEIAKKRMNDLDKLKTLPTLLAEAQLPKPPEPVKPGVPQLNTNIDLNGGKPLIDRPLEPGDFDGLKLPGTDVQGPPAPATQPPAQPDPAATPANTPPANPPANPPAAPPANPK